MKRWLLLLVVPLLLPACGSKSSSDTNASSGGVDGISVSTDVKTAPTVKIPSSVTTEHLVTKDIVEGTGPEASSGSTAQVQYAGYLTDGTKFDASWDRNQPFSFVVGGGSVIPGWDQGVAGMKEGGRRLLVIPPDLGYGAQGTPNGPIPPNATLVFVVDLVSVS